MKPTYILPVMDTIKTAWDKTYGAKKSLWAAFLVVLVIAFAFGIATGSAKYVSNPLSQVINIISQIVIFLLQMGLLYIAIQHVKGNPINYRMVFTTFEWPLALKLIGLYILQFIILIIPAVIAGACIGVFTDAYAASNMLMMIPLALVAFIATLVTIFLSIRLMMGMGIVLDQRLNPVDAVKKSFKATRGNVWPLIGIIIVESLIILVSIIPLGIGLIWTLPFAWVAYGIVYTRLLANTNS